MRVLVIDDEPDISEIVRLTFGLRWPEAEVLSVSTGEAGVDAASTLSPDRRRETASESSRHCEIEVGRGKRPRAGVEPGRGGAAFDSSPALDLRKRGDQDVPDRGLQFLATTRHRVERMDGNAVPGSGLGLAVARRLMDQQGGRIWVEAAASGGACFVVEVRASRPQEV